MSIFAAAEGPPAADPGHIAAVLNLHVYLRLLLGCICRKLAASSLVSAVSVACVQWYR